MSQKENGFVFQQGICFAQVTLSHATRAFICLQKYKAGNIHKAADKGDVKKLEECLNIGANIDEQDKEGRTPLMLAVLKRHTAAIDFLVARGRKSSSATSRAPLLCIGLPATDKDVCEALLKARADTKTDYLGHGAAGWAAYYGHKELAAFIESFGQVLLAFAFCCVVWKPFSSCLF